MPISKEIMFNCETLNASCRDGFGDFYFMNRITSMKLWACSNDLPKCVT